jgi:arginyl-tRNA synthetase
VLAECEAKGIVKLDKGAKCIFCPGFQIPLMVVKSDGAYNYDTTDLAAIRYRLFDLHADRIIYITDLGQQTHFRMIFEAAKMMGWHQPPKTIVEHMGFGVVRGGDGKKFKTRSGDTVKLMELLDEAQERALAQIKAKV